MNSKKATRRSKVHTRRTNFPSSGRRLKVARESAKVSLRALADEVGLSYETVRLVEQGRGGLTAFRTILNKGKSLRLKNAQKAQLLKGLVMEMVGAA